MNHWEITDDIIQQNNAKILDVFPIKPRYTPEKKTHNTVDCKAEDAVKNSLNNDIKKFLSVVNIYQYKKPLTDIRKVSGLTAGTGSRIAKECEKRNFIKIIRIDFSRGRPKYPVLLKEGYKFLGIQEKEKRGRGAGHEHTLYQHLVKEQFSIFKPVIELNRNDKFIDVAIETNELLIGIEIAMTAIHEKDNIEKNFFLAQVDFLIVACLNEKVYSEVFGIINQQSEHIRNNTKSYLIKDLLKTKPEELINNLQMTLF